MALKFTLLCIAAICLFQFITASPRVARDADNSAKAQKELEDAMSGLKNGLEQIAKSIQDSDLIKNFTTLIQNFGDEISDQGSKMVKKIQESATTA